jgi:hypothetical protein
MPKDWQEVSDEEILNFSDAQTGVIARYERIMQKRSIDAVTSLRDKLTGLMETIYRASQGLQEKADEKIRELSAIYERTSKSQSRQQVVLIALSIVVAASTAAYTWITWESVAAMRESNDIQRQLLELQKTHPVSQTAPNSIEKDAHKSNALPSS